VSLAIIEGPIVTVVCGFLVTLGFFNPFLVYIVMVLGDIVGDGIIYYLGFSGKRFLRYFKITDEKLEKAKKYFKDNHKKAIIISKLLHGIGFTGLVAAGASHVPYKRYLKTCTIISVVQSGIVLNDRNTFWTCVYADRKIFKLLRSRSKSDCISYFIVCFYSKI
jgi:membrane protein DedA with SNARE-associated domain